MRSVSRIFIVLLGTGAALRPQVPLQVGPVLDRRVETPHPYPIGRGDRPVVWRDVVTSAGAQFLRVHFNGFHLAPGDYVTVSNPAGSQFWTYSSRGPNGDGDFWSFAVDGDTAIVEIHAGPRNAHGYHIDAVGHGTTNIRRPGPTPEVVCGTDGREDIACHMSDPAIDAAQKPVARLLFVMGRYQYLCTGWLVAGSNGSTLMTNNHCIDSQKVTNTLQATFNFQRVSCGGSANAVPADFSGGVFLKTNSVNRKGNKAGLDYTLLTLQGNPEAVWGELIPTTKSVAVGAPIWFIQHPGGNLKEIGYWEDSSKTIRCKVDAIGQTYSTSATGSQTGYGCDSEGGSSGSPIVEAASGRVIALHHFGGVSNAPCLNSGTAMERICADAGSLLFCVSQ